jgi:hypothetical protein
MHVNRPRVPISFQSEGTSGALAHPPNHTTNAVATHADVFEAPDMASVYHNV